MENYSYNKRVFDDARKANNEKFKNESKRRLTKNVEKKFKTTMIGALASFENVFGELWGLGKEEDNLNNEELYWKDKWDIARNQVLNNGNSQLRAAIEEITEYSMSWNRYKTDFIIKR
jgi:hypothetical protein